MEVFGEYLSIYNGEMMERAVCESRQFFFMERDEILRYNERQ